MNAPDYDPDIDGQLDPVTDAQSLNTGTAKEDTPPDTSKSEHHTAISLTTNRPEPQPSEVSADTDHPVYHSGKQPRAEHPSDYHPQLEDILELETDEENWEEGQFEDAELIDHHNTTEESDRIRHEYSAHFEKVIDQEYSPYHSTTPGFEYQIPEPDYYNADTQPKQYQRCQIKCISPSPPSTEDLCTWYGQGHGRARHWSSIATD